MGEEVLEEEELEEEEEEEEEEEHGQMRLAQLKDGGTAPEQELSSGLLEM